jgi:branched-subunit amino acid transport protein
MTDLALLALLMAAVTYPARAFFLLVPGAHALPAAVRRYLRLVGPAMLAALAAVGVATRQNGASTAFSLGPEWIGVGLCLVLVAWRRNLLLGLIVAAATTALLRAAGVTGIVV